MGPQDEMIDLRDIDGFCNMFSSIWSFDVKSINLFVTLNVE